MYMFFKYHPQILFYTLYTGCPKSICGLKILDYRETKTNESNRKAKWQSPAFVVHFVQTSIQKYDCTHVQPR